MFGQSSLYRPDVLAARQLQIEYPAEVRGHLCVLLANDECPRPSFCTSKIPGFKNDVVPRCKLLVLAFPCGVVFHKKEDAAVGRSLGVFDGFPNGLSRREV